MAFVVHEGMKELYAAIKRGDVATVRRLLTENAHLKNVETFLNPSWLHDAAALGKGEIVELLLDLGLDINKIDKPAETSPLIAAIGNGHVEVAELLLNRGADPNVGRAFIAAINLEDRSIAHRLVSLLVDHGADVNRKFLWYNDPKMPQFTPLTWAEAKGITEIAEYLRSKGAFQPPNQSNSSPANREQEIVAHFEKQFGAVRPGALREVVPTGVPIALHVIPPSKTRNQLTLF